MFNNQQLNIIKYCAEECARQGSGEYSVYNMVNAWDWAYKQYLKTPKIDTAFITTLGILVEPNKNRRGLRKIPIFVGNDWEMVEKAPWERVPELLTLLLESYYDGSLIATHKMASTPEDQFYYEYENIHPFVDGNGRTGKILYNYLCGTLDNPIMPPDFWGSSNP